jgi:hypothetical protein
MLLYRRNSQTQINNFNLKIVLPKGEHSPCKKISVAAEVIPALSTLKGIVGADKNGSVITSVSRPH